MGRKRSYDEHEVLEKAMMLFWKNGYEHTSMRQLEKAMGINQFSIYDAFESKNKLFLNSLGCYAKKVRELFFEDLLKDEASRETIRKFFQKFSHSVRTESVPNGCLMVNSLLSIEQFEPRIKSVIFQFFEDIKNQFVRILKREYTDNDQKQEKEIKTEAEYLVGIAQSLSSLSKIKTEQEMEEYINFAMSKG